MQHAYASFNKALQALFTSIAPGVPVFFGHPVADNATPLVLPAECFRVEWLEFGADVGPSDTEGATVQIDIFVGNNDRATALARASAISTGLHLRGGAGFGTLGRYDYATTPPSFLSEMSVEAFESAWLTIGDPQPRVVHLVRTFELTYKV